MRADLNVPFSKGEPLTITDDTRVRAAVPTLKYLTDNGAIVLLTSHLVRDPARGPPGAPQPPLARSMRRPIGPHRVAAGGGRPLGWGSEIDCELIPDCNPLRSQGRPKGGPEAKFSLKPVAARLSELLGKKVRAGRSADFCAVRMHAYPVRSLRCLLLRHWCAAAASATLPCHALDRHPLPPPPGNR